VLFKLPKTPLKYVLPGVIGFTENLDGSKSVHDTLRLHPATWLSDAAEDDDTELQERIENFRLNHRHGTYFHLPLEEVCRVVQYVGDLPHTYKPLYVSVFDVMAILRKIESLHPEGSVIQENARGMAARIEGLPVELYKDDSMLVNAYLDSNLYVDPELPVKGGRSYEARLELQKLLTAEVIGDTYDYHT
jgi:hypothetical protein